jgi:hypothetical protein
MTDRDIMKQALDALEDWADWVDHSPPKTTAAIAALNERLKRQSEREAFDTLPDDYETGDY